MLSMSLSDCKTVKSTLNDRIAVSKFVRNSQVCHLFAKSLNHYQCLSLSLSLFLSFSYSLTSLSTVELFILTFIVVLSIPYHGVRMVRVLQPYLFEEK